MKIENGRKQGKTNIMRPISAVKEDIDTASSTQAGINIRKTFSCKF